MPSTFSRKFPVRPACRGVFLGLVALGSSRCAIDDRPVRVLGSEGERAEVNSNQGTGQTPGPAPEPSAEPGLSLSRSELDLGAAVTGFAALGRVSVSNVGLEPLGLASVSLASTGDPDFQIAQNQCASELAPGASCDVRIQLLPSKLGPIEGTLLVQTANGSTASVPLRGRGLQAGSLVLSPAPGSTTDFGGVLLGERSETDFRITNPSASPSGLLTLELAHEDFAVQAGAAEDCVPGAMSLAEGASCNVRLVFAPSRRGPIEATFSVTSANLGSASLGLNGEGQVAGLLGVSPPSLRFPGVVLAAAGTGTLTVRNRGDSPLTLGATRIEGEHAADFTIASTSCGEGTQLNGGAGSAPCNLDLEFRPSSAGARLASVVITAQGGLEQVVALEGEGLLPGVLTLSPGPDSSADFGDVLIGESLVRSFHVGNPASESSGQLTILGGNDFVVLGPSQAGDCESGVTVLEGGASCTTHLQLTPAERGVRHGTLTVVSELAGSSSLAVQGNGILPAQLVAAREEVNFGGIVRDASATDTLVISNDGDRPLPPLELSLGDATSGDAASFTFENGCDAELAPAARCEIRLTFQPTVAAAHSVALLLSSGNGDASMVLLRGVGLEPGSLEIEPGPGSSTDFGDVALNASVQRQFSVTNPGNVASGLLTITSSSNRFVVTDNGCASLAGAGLVDGQSCDFSVSFTPIGSDPVSANLRVASPGAGQSGLSLTGRGRRPALLEGGNVFDFSTVIISDSSAARRWTVSNGGDLATGVLVTSAASREFTVTSDSCNNRSLQGGAQCSLDVAFAPQAAGTRSGSISVAAGSSGVQATLSVRGVGQSLPGVGAACLSGRCQSGSTCENHSNGLTQVCCDADCAGTQRCSENQDFLACELPAVGPGSACSASVLCRQGLTCNAPTQPGRCCPSDCTGNCSVCNSDGTCSSVRDGQQGRCNNTQQCQSGACVSRPPASLSGNAALLDFGPALIGATAGNRQWTVTNTGGLATGTLSVSAPADFSATGSCVGGSLAAGNSCTLTVTFRPSVPGTRSGTLTLNGGQGVSASVSVSGTGDCGATRIAVSVGGQQQCRTRTGSPCTQNNECQDSFCRTWFLDLDSDTWGGTETTRICGNQTSTPPPSVIRPTNRGEATFNYVSRGGDCCDFLQENAAGRSLPPNNVNPGVTEGSTVAATLCPVPGDLNCDGVVITGVNRPIANSVFVSCPATPPAGGVCEDRSGYNAPPTCGETTSIISCRAQADGSCLQVNPLGAGPVFCF